MPAIIVSACWTVARVHCFDTTLPASAGKTIDRYTRDGEEQAAWLEAAFRLGIAINPEAHVVEVDDLEHSDIHLLQDETTLFEWRFLWNH